MASTATIYDLVDPSERRGAARRQIAQPTTVRQAGAPLTVVLHDLSDSGAMIETSAGLACGTTLTIGMPGLGRLEAVIVNKDGALYGCRFLTPLSPDAQIDAFGNDHIVPIQPSALSHSQFGTLEAGVDKWHGSVRIALPIGVSLLLWSGLISMVRALAHW